MGFGAPGGQNLAFPITLASRFYNSLYYRTSRDMIKQARCSVVVIDLLYRRQDTRGSAATVKSMVQ